jgi:prepilin peptidase CpaA
LEDTLQTAILICGIVLFVVAAYGDIRFLRIPNALVITVAVLGVVRLAVTGDMNIAAHTLAASIVLLIVAFLLFWRNYIGGGDAKLIAAAALLIGYDDLMSLLLIIAVCGFAVSLALVVIHKYFPLFLGPKLAALVPRARLAVPYGVAIAGGGIITLLFQPSLLG